MALRSYSVLYILLPTIIILIQECSQALEICKCLWSLSCGGVPNMLLVLPITFHFHYIYGVVCVQLAHFSLGDWEDISIAHVIIITKSEVSTLPIIIFFRGCVPQMFVTSYSVTYCIYIPGKPWFCFYYYCADYDECKYSDTFWLADRVRLLVHYTISLSSLGKLIWGHWTYEMPVRYILSSVWVRLSIFSQLSIIQYTGAFYPFPLWWLREYTLCLIIIIKSEVWTIIHCYGLGNETMVCAVCLFIFLWCYLYTFLFHHYNIS